MVRCLGRQIEPPPFQFRFGWLSQEVILMQQPGQRDPTNAQGVAGEEVTASQ
jgi:hypothetical protein